MYIDPYDSILCLTYQVNPELCIKVASLLDYDEKALGFTLSYYSPLIPKDIIIKDVLSAITNEDIKVLLTSSLHLHTEDE